MSDGGQGKGAGGSTRHIALDMRTTENETAIEISGLDKWFGSFHVLRGVDLKVMRGERVVICGPSGSGKSTLLRCINRIEDWQRGRVIIDGMELTEDLKKIDEVRREVGMVFQQFNLFPHLTVLDNCTLAPIWVRKLPKKEADEVARHFLERVRIPEQAQFSSTVRCGNRLKCWNTMPTSRRTSSMRLRSPVSSMPSTKIWPR